MTHRSPTKITVQYKELPYLPDQVTIARHYGKGVPTEYHTTVKRPTHNGVPLHAEWWVDVVCSRITDGPVTILPSVMTRNA